MPLSSGARLGAYEILSPLGAGGMGEVYKARDTKLGRDVAIKILPELFAADAARASRFEREARLLASLNHPHIAQIYGVEDAPSRGSGQPGVRAIVMELVEGQTLATRLARVRGKGLGTGEALLIARQIADALDAAHERGIVHRDLKPANIALTSDDTVKVLDFGLAKSGAGQPEWAGETGSQSTPDSSPANLTNSPTVNAPTMEGVVLGTAPYMSPEQARGQPTDKRTDIWAFGCVLYEMLAGRNPFAGATLTDTLAAIVEREPDWGALPAATPSSVQRLLRRCLEKDSKRRLHDIADARLELDEPIAAGPATLLKARARWIGSPLWIALALASVAIAAVVGLWIFANRAPATAPPARLSVFTPGQITPQLSATISPDGTQLAFVSTDASGKSMLWVRPLSALDARALPGTENAAHPFWSPDGRYLGFQAAGKIKTVDAAGGPVQVLADSPVRSGASWSPDGKILFIPRLGQLATVPASGGAPSPIAVPGLWPHFLPDGRHFLYFVGAPADRRGIWVGAIDSAETKRLLANEVKGAYAPPGYLLFVRAETLMAQPFDAERLELTGKPDVVADGVWTAAPAGQAAFSASRTGVVAYVNASLFNTQLTWLDRMGRQAAPIGQPERWALTPQLSPDGTRLAIARGPFAARHVWLVDTSNGATSRVTFGSIFDDSPVWSRDGSQIAFESGRADGGAVSLQDWSSDGQHLVFTARGDRGASDLWLLPIASATPRPSPFIESRFNQTQARISPDSRWIAYTSNESGTDEVYIQSFPTPGSKRQASSNGGVQPRWRRDGKELFYLAADQRLMAVPVRLGATFEADAPVPLFRTRLIPQGSQSILLPTAYDVSADGQRFVVTGAPDDPGPPITVVLDWFGALKR